MHRRILLLGSLWLSGLVASTQVFAAPITFGFTGTVLGPTGLGFLLGDDSFAGTPLQGTFTFDPDAVDLDPSPSTSLYEYPSGAFGLDVTIGSHRLVNRPIDPGLSIEIENAIAPRVWDQYFVESRVTDVSAAGSATSGFSLEFIDVSGNVFDSDAAPLVPPELAAFSEATFEAFGVIGNFPGGQPIVQLVRGTIDTWFLVPEPRMPLYAALGLSAALGMRGLAAHRRQKRN